MMVVVYGMSAHQAKVGFVHPKRLDWGDRIHIERGIVRVVFAHSMFL